MSLHTEWLGTDVGKHVCCTNKTKIDISITNIFVKPMVTEIDMLSSLSNRPSFNESLGSSIVSK